MIWNKISVVQDKISNVRITQIFVSIQVTHKRRNYTRHLYIWPMKMKTASQLIRMNCLIWKYQFPGLCDNSFSISHTPFWQHQPHFLAGYATLSLSKWRAKAPCYTFLLRQAQPFSQLCNPCSACGCTHQPCPEPQIPIATLLLDITAWMSPKGLKPDA